MEFVDLSLLAARLDTLCSKIGDGKSANVDSSLITRLDNLQEQLATLEKSLPHIDEVQKQYAKVTGDSVNILTTNPAKLITMATFIGMKRTQLSKNLSMLETIRTLTPVINKEVPLPDSAASEEGRLSALEESVRELKRTIDAETADISALLTEYEGMMKQLSQTFVRWDTEIARVEKLKKSQLDA